MAKTPATSETVTVEAAPVELDIDPEKAAVTFADLVTLDHKLRDEGSCLADLLRHVAASSRGII